MLPTESISKTIIATLLISSQKNKQDEPFFFLLGGTDPHLGFEFRSGAKQGKDIQEIEMPDFLPDFDSIWTTCQILRSRSNISIGRLVKYWLCLKATHQLDHTLIIATSDNGILFLQAKVNAYDYAAMYQWHSREEIRLLQDKSIIHS